MLYRTYRYSRWDGTQELINLDADELMDQLSDELLKQGDVMRALRELLRNGMQNREGQRMTGLREMMEQLKDQRRRQLQNYNMDSVVDDLKERLENILRTEREGIDRRLEQAKEQLGQAGEANRPQQEGLQKLLEQRAQRNKQKLDDLPESMAGQIQGLMEYDFMDPQAQQMFQELLDMLKQQMAQNMSQQMQQQAQGMSPEAMSAMREMLRQLNQMMRDKMAGREPDFQGFMDQFGPMFGNNPPQNFQELMEQLQQQLGQMQSMLESMSPEMRRQLEDAMNAALDPETRQQMAEFASLMEQMMPMDQLRRQYPFLGDDSLSMEQAIELMRQLQGMDQLEEALQRAMRTGEMDGVDPKKLAELLGEEARRAWEQMDRLRQLLKDAGYVTGDDKLELTARGIRRIGQKALKEVFLQLRKDRAGSHQQNQRGAGGDLTGETKPYEFGDPFQVDLQSTLKNAVLRGGAGVPVHMSPQDFEIYRTEHVTRAATAVLLDQSRSMGLFNNFQAAKKVTLALFALIRTQYPRDNLYVIGFSDYAREIKEQDLAKVNWNAWVSGTNLQHALMLSRKLLSRDKGSTRQILVITDGEPTSHLEGGKAYFSYPPSYRTELETLKEVKQCTKEGIVINTFMLENTYQLVNFVDRMTRINRGRAFYSSASNLGEYLLVDYVNNRKKRVAA
ncbi:MAG: VWA domain-containing protein [Dehalococcoidia bacterium]|nr:VWA domain-containing protein [Dehalococcoidia bacterium]MSQ17945.1 VWA domain-containing protein [Dehalococcoidia bacterium]